MKVDGIPAQSEEGYLQNLSESVTTNSDTNPHHDPYPNISAISHHNSYPNHPHHLSYHHLHN